MNGPAHKLLVVGFSAASLLYAVVGLLVAGIYLAEQASDVDAGATDEMTNALNAGFSLLSFGVVANCIQCVGLWTSGPESLVQMSLKRKLAVICAGAVMFLDYNVLLCLDALDWIQIADDQKLTFASALFLLAWLCSILVIVVAFSLIEPSTHNTLEQTPVFSPIWPTLLQQGSATASGFRPEQKDKAFVSVQAPGRQPATIFRGSASRLTQD
jgi:hypothetical protein